MNTTRTLAFALLAGLSLGACTLMPQNGNQTSSASSSAASVANADIALAAPLPDALVTSPLTVTGEARGSWYFEASFPVKLLDANGNVLAQAPAQAQADWMTTDFVPFLATLTFPTPATATGTLVLEKDNPSGMPQNAATITVPVNFQ